ncbi:MAG: hypothetical protein ABH865_02890 [Candidatus Omnitrophota bacterium]|nr:hypothetical protein [Candidatus Omnitrophota bacterium]
MGIKKSGVFSILISGMMACTFSCRYCAAESSTDTLSHRYIENPSQDASDARYEKGVELAAEGKFKEASEEFNQALLANEFNYNAEVALDIVNALGKGTVNENYVITTFTSRLVKLKLTKLERMLKEKSNAPEGIPPYIDTIRKEITELKKDIHDTLFVLRNRLERLEREIEMLKAKK